MKTIAMLIALFAVFAHAEDEPRVWVHAPVEDLLSLFPGGGAGYLISIEEFEKLRELAAKNRAGTEARAPVDARLVSGTVRGEFRDGKLELSAEYLAVSQADGPTELPFTVGNIALVSVEADDGAVYKGGVLRFEKRGSYTVRAKFSLIVAEGVRGLRRLAFSLPAAAGHTITIALPPRVEGEVGPILRAFSTADKPGTVTGFPDRHGAFRMWMRTRSSARKLDPIISATFAVMASVGEARTLASTKIAIDVLRAPIRMATIELLKGQLVHALTGKGVQTWRLVRATPRDKLEVTFLHPVQGRVELTMETELPRDDPKVASLPFPVVLDAVRYRGTVGLIGRPEVRLTALRATGARRLDKTPKNRIALYEIYDPAAKLDAVVEPVAAKTGANIDSFLLLGEGGKSLRIATTYRIAGKPLFRLEPRVPAGWTVRGAITLDGKPMPHRLLDDGRIILEFPNGLAPGTHVLRARLDTDEVDWVPESGPIRITLEGIRSGLDEERGRIAVASDTAFRVRVEDTNNVRTIGLAELGAAVNEHTLLAWAFDKPNPTITLEVQRHEPQLTATVIQRVQPKEKSLRMNATVALRIERAGIRKLRIALPKGTGKTVDFKGALIKERQPPSEGADPEIWTLVFQRRIRGLYPLSVRYDKTFDAEKWTSDVPAIFLPDASESGFVVVQSTASTAITVDRGGLREADVAELPQAPKKSPLEVLAYSQQPFSVKISSERHDPHAVLQAIALSAHIYGVVTQDGRLRCRAEYRVRNNDQAFLRCWLPANSRLIGALVDGKPIKPLLANGALKLPLARSAGRETPFLVALVYETRIEELDDTGEITIARPGLDIDVLKTAYSLHIPEGYELTGHDGDMMPMAPEEKETVLGLLEGYFVDEGFEMVAERVASSSKTAPAATPSINGVFLGYPKEKSPPMEEVAKAANDDGIPAETRAEIAEPELEEADKNSARYAPRVSRSAQDALLDFLAPKPAGAKDKKRPAVYARGGSRSKGAATPKRKRESNRGARTPRPERALLSLDVQFLKPDNVVRLDSLAPTGEVRIQLARREVFEVRGYLGFIIGLAAGILLLLAPRVSMFRILPAGALLIGALHFGGLSFLSNDFAVGAGGALALVLLLVLLRNMPRLLRASFLLLRKIRWPRRPAAGATVLFLAVSMAHAEEEILAPYRGDDRETIDRVFLPAKQYHELRRLAYPTVGGRSTVLPSAEYSVVRQNDAVAVTARYTIEKETDAVERIALRLLDVAVTSATLNDKPATLAVDKKRGYFLVLAAKGKYTLELSLRPRVRTTGKTSWVSLPVRPVATATLALTHDMINTKVHVGALGGEQDGSYRLGPVGTLALSWMPKTRGFEAPSAELRSDTYLQCSIRDGFTAIAGRVRYSISGGSVSRVRVAVDPSLTIRQVSAPNIAGWERATDGTITVALSKPAARDLVVTVLAERVTKRLRSESAPNFQPLDVLRDTGTITLETLPDLEIEIIKTQGLMRGKLPSRAPKFRATPEWSTGHSVHRFAVRPFELSWSVNIEATRLRAVTTTHVFLRAEETVASVILNVETERGPGEFDLHIGMPNDYEVLGVSGPHLREWWVKDGRLFLARQVRSQKRAQYRIDLRRRGATAEGVPAPALVLIDAVRQTGTVRIRVEDGLEVEAGESDGLLPINLNATGIVRAYRHVAVPWRLTLSTHRERREMDAMTITRVVPLPDRIRVEALVNFHVRRGLVREVSFTVPVDDENDIVLVAPEKREARSTAVEGGRRYVLSLRNATRGSIAATIRYHVPYGTPIRGVEPEDVSQVSRYVVVEKIADGEVKLGDALALEDIEFDELPIIPPGSSKGSAAAVYVGSSEPFQVDVAIRTHQFEEVAAALIYSASAQVVVDRTGWTRVAMSYRIYNRSRQFLELTLPDGAQLYSTVVAGEGVRPLQHGGRVLVPLRKVAIGATTFDADVIYAYKSSALKADPWNAKLPEVVDIDVRRTTLSLYLPREFDYEFNTKMHEVESSEIAVGQAADLLDEIKELYAVAERGNTLQVERALANSTNLEKELRRVREGLKAQTVKSDSYQQLEAQSRAIDSLRRQRASLLRVDSNETRKDRAEFNDTQQVFGKLAKARGLTVDKWKVNDAYLAQNKLADNEGLKVFRATNRRGRGGADRGPNGAVPPGTHQPTTPLKDVVSGLDGRSASVDNSGPGVNAGGAALEPSPGLFFNDGSDGSFLGRAENKFNRDQSVNVIGIGGGAGDDGGRTAVTITPLESVTKGIATGRDLTFGINPQTLTRASGRVSLRIELPREGKVFHFAAPGSHIEIEVEASETDGSAGEGFLAILLLGAAVFVLRIRRK